MATYTTTQKNKFELKNLMSLLEYVGVVLEAWLEEQRSPFTTPSMVLTEKSDELLGYYVANSYDCGRSLPISVLTCRSMKDLRAIYHVINTELAYPNLDKIINMYQPRTGVSIEAANKFMKLL